MRIVFVLMLVVSFIAPLSGCKYTDVLTQQVIDQSAEEIDYSLPPARLEASTAESDHVTMDERREDDDKEAEFEPDKPDDPTYDQQDPTTNETTPEANPAKDADSSTAPTSDANETNNTAQSPVGSGAGDGNNGADASSSGEGSNGNSGPSEQDGEEEGQKGRRIVVAPTDPSEDTSGSNEQNADGSADNSQDTPTGYTEPNGGGQGDGGQGRVYGGDGTYTELPNNTKGIAATGQMATNVQMLGGKGALRAADEQWLADMDANGTFPGELSDVRAGWSGDGRAPSSIDVDAVIDSGATVVLTSAVDGGLFNDQETADRLMTAGVSVIVMPPIGVSNVSDADIVQAVRIVGELLKNAGGSIQFDSEAMAGEWVRQHDSVLSSVVSANGGYAQWWQWDVSRGMLFQGGDAINGTAESWVDTKTPMFTCYIDGWAEANYSTYNRGGVTYNISEGSGYSAVLSDVTENKFSVIDYYMQHAGVTDTVAAGIPTAGHDGAFFRGSEYDGLFDWPEDRRGMTYCNALLLDVGTGTEDSTRFVRSFGNPSGPAILGTNGFPALIARNPYIADKVKRSAEVYSASPYNPIWSNHGGTNSEESVYEGRKPHFLDSYQVVVLPEGVAGSWADGTPESFLTAPWAWDVFKRAGDMSDCTAAVNKYYETFYRTGGALLSNYGIVEDVITNKGADY